MQIKCPKCHAVYSIEDSRIPETGYRFQCGQCRLIFYLRKYWITDGDDDLDADYDIAVAVESDIDVKRFCPYCDALQTFKPIYYENATIALYCTACGGGQAFDLDPSPDDSEHIDYCPKCGALQVLQGDCINCGIVFAKYAAALQKEAVKMHPIIPRPQFRPTPPAQTNQWPSKSALDGLNNVDKSITIAARIGVGILIFLFGCVLIGMVSIAHEESVRPSYQSGSEAWTSGGGYGLVLALMLIGTLYLCWYVTPKIIPPLKTGLGKDKLIIIIAAVIACLMGLFPPFHFINHGNSYSRGYHFILSAPINVQIDLQRLFVQWVVLALVTFIVYFFSKELQKQKQP